MAVQMDPVNAIPRFSTFGSGQGCRGAAGVISQGSKCHATKGLFGLAVVVANHVIKGPVGFVNFTGKDSFVSVVKESNGQVGQSLLASSGHGGQVDDVGSGNDKHVRGVVVTQFEVLHFLEVVISINDPRG